MSEKLKVGRIAIRAEGDLVVARYAEADTMDGAIFLSSMSKAAADACPEAFQLFLTLNRTVVGRLFEFAGVKGPVEWQEPERAPEHERAGNG